MAEIMLAGQRVALGRLAVVGEGGEAVVRKLDDRRVIKIYRTPNDPEYQGVSSQLARDRAGAAKRLQQIDTKLRQFPQGLPNRVVAPLELAFDRAGKQVVGFTMPFVQDTVLFRSLAKRKERPAGVDQNAVVRLFRDLHQTVRGVHKAGVVIGDFNWLNVLAHFGQQAAYLIDADSMSYGGFPCRTFTDRFVDPVICDPLGDSLVQIKEHTADTDWYAFAAMLFDCLMFVNLYGGVYAPKSKAKQLKPATRPLKRVSVMDTEVTYPIKATPLDALPDELLHFFEQLVARDKRGEFPEKLLNALHWTTCSKCGREHAKSRCPGCGGVAPVKVVRETVRGKVRVVTVFETGGLLLKVVIDNGTVRYLYNANGEFRREDGRIVTTGSASPGMRFGILGDETIVGQGGQLVVLSTTGEPRRYMADRFREQYPVFQTQGARLMLLSNGQLLGHKHGAEKFVGDVLRDQTRFWVGTKFGFGFYRAGEIQMSFVFDPEHRGIIDNVAVPAVRGQLVDLHCVFSSQRAWFFQAVQEGGKTVNYCTVVKPDGTVTATAQAEEGDGTWLGSITGKCAGGLPIASGGVAHVLFAISAEGIVRIHEEGGQLVERAQFPDSRDFVDDGDELLLGNDGIYVIDRHSIKLIQLT